MNIQPISAANNTHLYASNNNQNPSFKTKLKLTFSPHSIPCNYSRGELEFAQVISRFEEWLRNESPSFETLTIRKKIGNMVKVAKTKINGRFMGGDPVYVDSYENLEFEMRGARCGFCWNEQSGFSQAMQDLKNTFNYVKSQAGY